MFQSVNFLSEQPAMLVRSTAFGQGQTNVINAFFAFIKLVIYLTIVHRNLRQVETRSMAESATER